MADINFGNQIYLNFYWVHLNGYIVVVVLFLLITGVPLASMVYIRRSGKMQKNILNSSYSIFLEKNRLKPSWDLCKASSNLRSQSVQLLLRS